MQQQKTNKLNFPLRVAIFLFVIAAWVALGLLIGMQRAPAADLEITYESAGGTQQQIIVHLHKVQRAKTSKRISHLRSIRRKMEKRALQRLPKKSRSAAPKYSDYSDPAFETWIANQLVRMRCGC